MEQLDLTIRIAGENGEGVLTVGDVLAEALARSGLFIYTFKNLPAEIKGGASMTQVEPGIGSDSNRCTAPENHEDGHQDDEV